jgi:hypothetical protein
LSNFQFPSFRIVQREPGKPALRVNKFATSLTACVGLIEQPIAKNQTGSVIVGMVENILK